MNIVLLADSTSREDYWNPIEPSARGGAKIAGGIMQAVRKASR